jgi:predicted MPP superfamily phosphohydrolase
MWVGAYWMGAMVYLLLTLPIANVVGLSFSLMMSSREESVQWIGTVVLTMLVVILIWGSRNAWSPVARRYEFHLNKSRGQTPSEPIRIIVASDLHLGTIVGRRHLKRWVKRVNEFQPDLVLIPGDLVDDDIRPFLANRMDEVFREIRSRWGVIAITGNHDPFKDVNQGFMNAMEAAGIKMLMDEHIQIDDRLIVVGREERSMRGWTNSRKPLSQLMEGLDQSLPIIVMDHQPLGLAEASALGTDIMLSGHTHRGQLAPSHLITRRIFDLDYGYRQFGNMHAIVSSGYGTWGPPIRIGSRCEYIELILT